MSPSRRGEEDAPGPQGEILQSCDLQGRPLGPVSRELCHGDPAIVHLVVHLHVFDPEGRLLLQRRSAHKDLYPGRWDTAVGGHVAAGESVRQALKREALEELGLDATAAKPVHDYLHRNEHESEYVHAFRMLSSGPFLANPEEIDEVQFFPGVRIETLLGSSLFTPNFEAEYALLRASGVFGHPDSGHDGTRA